jgi:hypothetical protein
MTMDSIIHTFRELFDYEPDTGILRWKRGKKSVGGREVGSHKENGYLYTRINGKSYYVHRIIFALVTGRFPEMVDHKNCIKDDNRWENLRECNAQQNGYNSAAKCATRKTSKFKGVYWHKQRGKWCARIMVNYRNVSLGLYDTEEAAHAAYAAGAKQYAGEFHRA